MKLAQQHFTLRQLQIFIATAHYQNVSQAAEALAMSQSAASSALKELEAQFDIQLFDRVGKRLQLNSTGETLRAQAAALLQQASELEQSFLAQPSISELSIGATLTIGNYLAIDLIQAFKRLHPKAKLELKVANTQSIANAVRNFEIDIGLIEGEYHDERLLIEPWQNDELSIFCSPAHPFAKKRKLSDKDLTQAKWVMREQGSGTRQIFERAMSGLSSDIDIELELEHTEAIKHAVSANMGLGCLSKTAINEGIKRGDFVALKAPQRDFTRQFYFVLHKQKYTSEAVKAWLALCKSKKQL